jgi:hypothetical protein
MVLQLMDKSLSSHDRNRFRLDDPTLFSSPLVYYQQPQPLAISDVMYVMLKRMPRGIAELSMGHQRRSDLTNRQINVTIPIWQCTSFLTGCEPIFS